MSGNIIKPKNMPIYTTFKEPIPMVIEVEINDFSVFKVSVNPTSQVDILYLFAFLKLGLSESMLKPCEASYIKGVLGEGVPVKGYIDLDTYFGEEETTKMITVRYFVVDSPSAYNIVIGMPALKALKAFISLSNLTLEYPILDGDVVD